MIYSDLLLIVITLLKGLKLGIFLLSSLLRIQSSLSVSDDSEQTPFEARTTYCSAAGLSTFYGVEKMYLTFLDELQNILL